MALINIIVAVNGSQLAQQVKEGAIKPGSADSPSMLGAYAQSDVYITMIAQNCYASNAQGQSELTVKANSGDILRWNMVCFNDSTRPHPKLADTLQNVHPERFADYTAFIYNGNFKPSVNISPLVYMNIVASEYLPRGSKPKGPLKNYHNHVYIAEATVLQPATKIQYVMAFQLVNNASGKVIGYFVWDPFISVFP